VTTIRMSDTWAYHTSDALAAVKLALTSGAQYIECKPNGELINVAQIVVVREDQDGEWPTDVQGVALYTGRLT
jgi:hypothetical protein